MTLTSALVDGQRGGRPFAAASFAAPETLDAAEAIQADVASALSADIAGWKIGFAPDANIPVAAPLFSQLILPDGGTYEGGAATFVAVEIEIGFRLVSDVESRDPERAVGHPLGGLKPASWSRPARFAA